MLHNYPFPPYIKPDSKILILGTFPSIKSFESNFYYGNPKNQFWELLSSVYLQPKPQDIRAQKKLLDTCKIALWDVIKTCERKNSSDSNLRVLELNDLPRLLLEYPNIENLYFSSKMAQKYAESWELKIASAYLPSPSPTYAALTLTKKLEIWRASLLG